jgi:hypothetical protein
MDKYQYTSRITCGPWEEASQVFDFWQYIGGYEAASKFQP